MGNYSDRETVHTMPLVIVDSGVDAFTVPAKKFLVS